jgi:polyhydroxyalkanoate synthesis repressor PhaR
MPAVVIRKYPNRRLYHTSAGKYVNPDDIAAMVRGGADVQVVDAKTGEDLTRVVLTQIIVEDARDQPTGLPLELLRQLIMATDRAGQEFILWYLKSAFDAYHKVRDTVQNGLTSPFSMVRNLLTPGDGELEQLRRRVAELEAQAARRKR